MAEKERTVIVSNRLPVAISNGKCTTTTGGLASALSGLMNSGSPILWIGWSGVVVPNADEEEEVRKKIRHAEGTIKYEPVFMTKDQVEGFYDGFSNSTLWPLLHYFPTLTQFNEEWNRKYLEVNRLFCDVVLKNVRPGDLIWIHDYHLMFLPAMLREVKADLKIGFFLHVPFPSYELFRCIPERHEIIEGLLGCDLIGFHTFSYVRHFKSCVLRCLGLECHFDTISYQGRTVKLGVHPIGINCQSFLDALKTDEYKQCLEEYARDFAGKKLVLSVSRLDYTKGIPTMLKSIEYFLREYSNTNEEVIFLVIAVPSRENVDRYVELKNVVVKTIGEINGKYSKISAPPPVQFIHYSVNVNKLCALYTLADVALVLPLIDGMNLVAKEYIAVQGETYDPNSLTRPGVLILSEFTGAAQELYNAYIVNPYNCKEVACTIRKCLDLDPKEKLQMNLNMTARVRYCDADYWAKNFLRDLRTELTTDTCKSCRVSAIVPPFLPSAPGKKILFLDYDGTLVPIASAPHLARPSRRLLQILTGLSKRPDLDVVIVSGRASEFLDQHLGAFSKPNGNFTFSAEHGYLIRKPGQPWEPFKKELIIDWKPKILPYLELYSKTTPGSFIEEKSSGFVWHYRLSDLDLGRKNSTDLVGQLSEFVNNLPIEIHHGKKIVEVSSIEINKGQIIKSFLHNDQYSAAVCIGDDITDETMFRLPFPELVKIKIGEGDTAACYRWPKYERVLEFLEQIK
eukprot:TRINITY_DN2743_c0_g2_i1.p1 TRINITY_DN2743_c0_g2~~TRINITY_DN2743_c0_g2_i1.p1  ORF type:complete len:739 (+),score=73.18 TRINITY_DN2743_c0_g2_i1:78-2294(+)